MVAAPPPDPLTAPAPNGLSGASGPSEVSGGSGNPAPNAAPDPGPSGPPRPIATPCIQVCAVDGASGLCLGCYRTLAEIAGWTRLAPDRRARLMAELPLRRGRIAPEKLALFAR